MEALEANKTLAYDQYERACLDALDWAWSTDTPPTAKPYITSGSSGQTTEP